MTVRNDRRIALIIGAVLAGVFTLCAAVQVAEWTTGSVERATHEVIPGPVGSLTIDARGANVRLVPSETNSVRLDTQASGTLKPPKLQVRPEGARVEVSGGCPEITFGHCEADIIVAVPAGTSVRVQAGSGDITADNLSGNVDLHSSSGDVAGRGLSGFSVQLRSNSGDITAAEIRAAHVVTRTASGDVVADLERAPESVDARSNSGDVAVLVPPGDELYRVEAETDSGDRNVGVAMSTRAESVIEARTNSGDVNVDYGS
jgi:DUF4097 and DUF4098 domain-containing protein YvlB